MMYTHVLSWAGCPGLDLKPKPPKHLKNTRLDLGGAAIAVHDARMFDGFDHEFATT